MSSAFFRRPDEDSSDSSDEDESGGNQDHSPSQQSESSYPGPEIELAPTESLSTEASVTQQDVADSEMPEIKQHRDFMFAALLEDFCKTRAAELINTGAPGANYHRLSPEAQPLARKLYQEASQALSVNGFLPAGVTSASRSTMREQYLTGLDSLSLRNVQDGDIAPRRTLPQLENADDMALIRMGRRGSAELIREFEPPVGNILMQTGRMNIPSPQPDMQMALRRTTSHYETSFQQMGILGKGGFGRVYHAFNIFDKKDYAVKKIPLSPGLSKRYQQSGHRELESVLSEVQALAQLENSNCVRYHACWIEEPSLPPQASHKLSREPPAQRLLTNRPHISNSSTSEDQQPVAVPHEGDQSSGVVFGYSEKSHSIVHNRSITTPKLREWSADAAGLSVHDSSHAPTSEIFTDGHGQGRGIESEIIDPSLYVLHVQMSLYPLTLTQYLAPPATNSISTAISPSKRHCFHLIPSLRILLGILCGLQYIHAKGLIHRDIKPSNIFLSTLTPDSAILKAAMHEGFYDVGSCSSCPEDHRDLFLVNPRIGDFGLVAELARSGSHDAISQHKHVGTAFYRPCAEEINGNRRQDVIDEKLDVFALGVILIELLVPFATNSERIHVLRDLQRGFLPSTLAAKIEAEASNTRLRKGTGQRVERCVQGMLHSDARLRWGCDQVRNEIEILIEESQSQPRPRTQAQAQAQQDTGTGTADTAEVTVDVARAQALAS